MFWYQAGSTEWLVSRITAVAGLLCFNTYTVMALIFALISFTGMWAMYLTFIKIRPQLYKELAIATLFVPSVFFWGSGLMKDSLCIGALGWLSTPSTRVPSKSAALLPRWPSELAWLIHWSHKDIHSTLLSAAGVAVDIQRKQHRIKSGLLRLVAKPVLMGIGGGLAFYAATNLTAGDANYDIDNIGERSKIVSEYLYETGIKQDGVSLYAGQAGRHPGRHGQAGTAGSRSGALPAFLWEVRNPVMLPFLTRGLGNAALHAAHRPALGPCSARLRSFSPPPSLTLCFVFAIIFSGTVGIVSNNFGTLVRYKIPMIPFYLAGLYITQSMSLERSRRAEASRPARATARRLSPGVAYVGCRAGRPPRRPPYGPARAGPGTGPGWGATQPRLAGRGGLQRQGAGQRIAHGLQQQRQAGNDL